MRKLPREVIRLILEFHRDDKTTLASCMRVSPSFNAIAAPILYHTVELKLRASWPERRTSNPFYIPPKDTSVTSSNAVPTKEQCLAYVRCAVIHDHSAEECDTALESLSDSGIVLELDTIKFMHHPDQELRGIESHFARTQQCGIRGSFRTQRIVLADVCPLTAPCAYGPIPAAHTSITIFRREHDQDGPYWDPDYNHRREFASSSAIYIFYDYPPVEVNSEGQLGSDWCDFMERLESDFHSALPSEILIVGLAAAHPANLQIGQPDLARNLRVQAEKRFKNCDCHGDDNHHTELKLVSMQEYLKEYDWTGVFEEAEARPWLDD